MLNWSGFVAWFDGWSSDAVDGLTSYAGDLLASIPLYQIIEFVLSIFGVTWEL